MEAFPNSDNDSDALNSNNLMMNVCQSVGQEFVRNIRDDEDDAVMESIAGEYVGYLCDLYGMISILVDIGYNVLFESYYSFADERRSVYE